MIALFGGLGEGGRHLSAWPLVSNGSLADFPRNSGHSALVESFGRRRRTKAPEERTCGPEALAMGIWEFQGTGWRLGGLRMAVPELEFCPAVACLLPKVMPAAS